MCDSHLVDDTFWLRKVLLRIYGRLIDNTLEFYLFMGKMTKIPLLGPAVRYFARQYGRYYHGGRAATVEECRGIISQAARISVMDCACRKLNGRCDNHVNTCITVNTSAEVFNELKDGKFISKEEAMNIVLQSFDRGMIRAVHHCIAPNTYALCNCCTCCCIPYRLRQEYGIETAVENGIMVANFNKDNCSNCGKCKKICPQKALYPEQGVVSSTDCLGCGLCVAACPSGCIEMKARTDSRQICKLPGKTEKFLMYLIFLTAILPAALVFKASLNLKKFFSSP